jgi:hypothetical protein
MHRYCEGSVNRSLDTTGQSNEVCGMPGKYRETFDMILCDECFSLAIPYEAEVSIFNH